MILMNVSFASSAVLQIDFPLVATRNDVPCALFNSRIVKVNSQRCANEVIFARQLGITTSDTNTLSEKIDKYQQTTVVVSCHVRRLDGCLAV